MNVKLQIRWNHAKKSCYSLVISIAEYSGSVGKESACNTGDPGSVCG